MARWPRVRRAQSLPIKPPSLSRPNRAKERIVSPKELEEIKGRHQRVLTERVERYADPDHLFWDAENMSRAVMDLSRDLLEARADKAALLGHISYQDKALEEVVDMCYVKFDQDELWINYEGGTWTSNVTPDFAAWLRSKGEKG